MAISGFGRGNGSKSGSSSTAAVPASSGSGSSSSGGGVGNLTAFIDQGSEFEGKLSFRDTVRIDGTFSGEISSDNTLIVGESGEIHASIKSVCVVISGLVEGDVCASDQIVLHKTAVVKGNLDAAAIIMEEGAQLNGTVRMSGASSMTSTSSSTNNASSNGDKSNIKAVPDASSGPKSSRRGKDQRHGFGELEESIVLE
jgi:cytoskeletal protein CcmA (bactofilin family)